MLNLYSNQLSSLPESIGRLVNLQELFLSNNKLSSLPESIGRLASLLRLYLDNNQLSVQEIRRIEEALPGREVFTGYHVNELRRVRRRMRRT